MEWWAGFCRVAMGNFLSGDEEGKFCDGCGLWMKSNRMVSIPFEFWVKSTFADVHCVRRPNLALRKSVLRSWRSSLHRSKNSLRRLRSLSESI